MKTDKQELSIYIHIPFCKKKCLYCDFLSAPCEAAERETYVKALLCELKTEAAKAADHIVVTVFLGGGTPSLLCASSIERIVKQIKKYYQCSDRMEISMECNPGTATPYKVRRWREAGINRLSIGLQSADKKELKALGRIHNFSQFEKTYRYARQAGFTNINVDIMSALPGQSLSSYQRTLQKVIELCPEHISAYSLIIEEGTPFFEYYGENSRPGRYLPLPNEDTERTMYYETQKILKAAGFYRYEISNYAKKGYACRHNLAYWTGREYLGFGIGAASYFEGTRYTNIRDREEYIGRISRGESVHTDIHVLSQKEKEEEYMFVGLRLTRGIGITQFAQLFGRSMKEVYGESIQKLIKEGLLCKRGDYLKLTKRGTDISNYVLSQFLQD